MFRLVMATVIVALSSWAPAAQTITDVPTPPRRPTTSVVPPPPSDDCLERLRRSSIATEKPRLATPKPDSACEIASPVILVSVTDPKDPGRSIMFSDRPKLSCVMAERFALFTSEIAAPLALGTLDRALVAISTGPGHECRPRNRQPGAKLSSHGQGNAVDISRMDLFGGLKITIRDPADAASERFIAGFRAAACGVFSTVLGPGSDAAHYDHIHVDIEMRGRDGRSKFCQ